ncbi:hypothetical protein DJ021_08640 [Phenylobacterium hankyongense]|uniref:PH domain-containing protein n=1 Tax=Phenylobacterium hankyongense TaxID=1813876 RepID=A0A328B4C3_9CAUL|nr:hypothetical protein [Phenylobacterium hankyongense]RAK59868.1 hypothetical protein DJ021_08640 [Phenylobacterium hankyongense]
MVLAAACAPIAGIGAVDLVLAPTEWPYGVGCIALGVIVVGYNFTARLSIDADFVTFSRYGRVVWRAPRSGTQIEDGLAGDMPFIPALILRQGGKKVGFVLKGWFDDNALSELRKAVSPSTNVR